MSRENAMSDVLTLTALLLSGLATWRLSSLLHTEDAFEWLRKWIGIGNDAEGYPAIYPETFWGNVFDCFWCLSLAAAVPIVALVVVVSNAHWAWALPIWLASSSFAIWLEKQIMRTQSR
jgi:hypothetical protein